MDASKRMLFGMSCASHGYAPDYEAFRQAEIAASRARMWQAGQFSQSFIAEHGMMSNALATAKWGG